MMINKPSIHQITGQTRDNLVDYKGIYLHKAIVEDWLQLIADAQSEGFDLCIASGFRDFDRQLLIWNEKASGLRPILGDDGKAVCLSGLKDCEIMFAILRWSALPGASRHHWGTDLDVYDRAATPERYKVQLTDEEAEGAFAPLHRWLDEKILSDTGCYFFRPYCGHNGFNAERWHLSHRVVSREFELALSKEALFNFYEELDNIQLKSIILENFDLLYARYIAC